jgi:hypothetical protein
LRPDRIPGLGFVGGFPRRRRGVRREGSWSEGLLAVVADGGFCDGHYANNGRGHLHRRRRSTTEIDPAATDRVSDQEAVKRPGLMAFHSGFSLAQ